MTKLSWAIVCVLVVFNSAAIVASYTGDVRGAQCDQDSCSEWMLQFYECWHAKNAKDGDPCSAQYCIDNVLTNIECASGEIDHCISYFDPNWEWATQTIYEIPLGSGASCQTTFNGEAIVKWMPYSPNGPCIKFTPFNAACKATYCGGWINRRDPIFGRYGCGCR